MCFYQVRLLAPKYVLAIFHRAAVLDPIRLCRCREVDNKSIKNRTKEKAKFILHHLDSTQFFVFWGEIYPQDEAVCLGQQSHRGKWATSDNSGVSIAFMKCQRVIIRLLFLLLFRFHCLGASSTFLLTVNSFYISLFCRQNSLFPSIAFSLYQSHWGVNVH